MTPGSEGILSPHMARITTAQTSLNKANQAPISPLETLAPAGYLITAYRDALDTAIRLLNGWVPPTLTYAEQLALHGQLNRLAETGHSA